MQRTLTLTLALAALLVIAPVSAADAEGPQAPGQGDDGPCDLFWYSIDPVGYKVDASCLPLPAP